MESPDTAGAYDSRPTDAGARAERSRQRSAESSSDGGGKEGTATAGEKQSDLEIELSILQSDYEKCLNAGLKARAILISISKTLVFRPLHLLRQAAGGQLLDLQIELMAPPRGAGEFGGPGAIEKRSHYLLCQSGFVPLRTDRKRLPK